MPYQIFLNVAVVRCFLPVYESKKVKVHPCTGTEAVYRLYGP